MNTKFPDGTKYVSCLTPPVVDGRANVRKYFATNSNSNFTYLGSNEIRIEITADRGAMLNGQQGYLEFEIGAVSQNINNLDGGAWSWIDEMAIQSDGQDIERLTSYNLLHTVLSQYTSNVSHLIQENVLTGSIATLNNIPSFDNGASTGSNVFVTDASGGFLSTGGRSNYDPFQTASIDSGSAKTFCVPVISGFLSSNLYCPVGESRGFTIFLRLAPDKMVGVWAADGGTYTISKISYNVPVVTIEDSVFRQAFNNMLRSDGSNAVCWRGLTYRHYVSTMDGTGDRSIIINDRSRSLSSMFCVLRTTNQGLVAHDRFALSTRTITEVKQFQIRIGDILFPNSQIDILCNGQAGAAPTEGRDDLQGRHLGSEQNNYNVSRAYCEVAKMFGMLHNTMTGGLVSLDSYGSDEGLICATTGVPNATTTQDNKNLTHYGLGILGVDLQTYSGDSAANGIDTARNNLNVTLLFNLDNGNALTYQIDTYSICNAVYRLDAAGTFSSSY